jgi:hypothetical protein
VSNTNTVLKSTTVSPVSSPPDTVAVLDRQRSDDRDSTLPFLDREAEPQPALEPGHERRVGPGQRDEQLIGQRQTRQPRLRAHAHPTLPALLGEQLPGRLLQPLAVAPATLGTLGVGQPALGLGHDGPSLDLGPARCGPAPSPPHPRTGASMGRPGPQRPEIEAHGDRGRAPTDGNRPTRAQIAQRRYSRSW